MDTFDFDKIIDRRGTTSEKWDVGADELPMWVADMDFQTAPAVREAMQKRLDHGIFGYTGIPDAWYEAYIQWWEKRHAFSIKKEWMIFSTGVVPAISSLVRKLTTPAEKVLVETPIYNIFFNSILNNGRVPLECPLTLTDHGYEMDFAALEDALSDPQTTLMLLCNPQNPGGRAWDAETLKKLAELCRKYGVTVVSDEIHCDLTDPGTSYVPFASVSDTAREISVTCISPSKAFNVAGMHSAAVIVPNENLRHKVWRGLNTDEAAEPNCFAVETAVAAYTEGEAWLDALRSYLYENKKTVSAYVKENIPVLQMIPQDATYLLWIKTSNLPNEGKGFAEFLRKKTGLYLSDGEQYGEAGIGFIRMNIACPRSVVKDGLERLKKGTELYQKRYEDQTLTAQW